MKPTTSSAYKASSINEIYNLLFCDSVAAYREQFTGDLHSYPWSVLFDDRGSDSDLQKVLDDESLETRYRLLAAYLLRQHGQNSPRKQLLGIVIEVDMGDGLDTLAVYQDGSARYINYSEKMIVWDAETERSRQLSSNLFQAAQLVVDRIGPWDGERLPPPKNGNARMTFLVTDGLYFGEGPQDALAKDGLAGPIMQDAALLMNYLINTSLNQSE